MAIKKSIWLLCCIFVISAWVLGSVNAQSSEVTESVTTSFYGTSKVFPLGPDRGYMTWENFGVVVSDSGGGLFHGATLRCIGANFWEKESWEGEGYCASTLKDGEKVFSKTKFGGKTGNPIPPYQGTQKMIGGTGKYLGIEGGSEFTVYFLRPSAEGIMQTLNRVKITYKLP